MTTFRRHTLTGVAMLLASALATTACAFDSSVAPRVELAVIVDGDPSDEFVTNGGYTVRLTRLRAALENVEFTTSGEMHAALMAPLLDLVVPTAFAHPGHYAGGEVIGEMNGRIIVDWLADGEPLGTATLLEGSYDGANFVFTRALASDGIAPDDALVGHTFEIAGEARKGGQLWSFSALIDEDDGRRVVGLPFEVEIDGGTHTEIGLQMLPVDPFEMDTVLDNLDFAALDEDGDGTVVLEAGQAAYNTLRKQLQVHDIYTATQK